MKKSFWILIAVALSFATLFVGIGYAQITDNLTISGNVGIKPQEGVYITDIAIPASLPTGCDMMVNGYVSTLINSRVQLATNGRSTFTVNVTVYNSTNETYGYNVMKYKTGSGTYDNENIEITTTMKKKNVNWKVEPGQTLTFPVTFSYVGLTYRQNNVLNSVVTFEFLPFDKIPDDSGQNVVKDTLGCFEDVLNDPDKSAQLNSAMAMEGYTWLEQRNRNDSYISNVSGATSKDKDIINNNLFKDKLNMIIDGEEKNVSILIKREEVDSNFEGEEMMVFMTTDPLDKGGSRNNPHRVIVYVGVYVKDNGKWVLRGEMFEGTAPVTSYGGSFGTLFTGSFSTDYWQSSKEYNGVPSGSKLSDVMAAIP